MSLTIPCIGYHMSARLVTTYFIANEPLAFTCEYFLSIRARMLVEKCERCSHNGVAHWLSKESDI